MSKKQLRALLEKYRNSECTPEEEKVIHNWYDQLGKGQHWDDVDQNELEKKIWTRMQQELADDGFKTKRSYSLHIRYWWGVAAILLLVIGISIYNSDNTKDFESHQAINSESTPKLLTEVNTSDKLKKLLLEDGSVITLVPGSSVSYPFRFIDQVREVVLEGEAFFEIAPKPDQPFIVKRDHLITRVLGTSFWIKENDQNKTLEVTVVTGKVTVFEENKEVKSSAEDLPVKSVLINPNESVTYHRNSGEIYVNQNQQRVQQPENSHLGNVLFENTNLQEILVVFQKMYGVDIKLKESVMRYCNFTGDLTDMQFYDALNLVCKSVNATYYATGGDILISGEGCN